MDESMHSRQRKLEQKADFLNDPLIRDTSTH